jgi:SHS2 domain-containing protein
MAVEGRSRGHAARPHTADVIIEAWAPTAPACYEEAVSAFVEVFADTAGIRGGSDLGFDVGPGLPEDLLVLLLEELLTNVEAHGLVPVSARVGVVGDRLVGSFTAVPAGQVESTGPVPKGVSYNGLSFERHGRGWRCRATVDV